MAINIVNTTSSAYFTGPTTQITGGNISLATSANTDALGKGDGSSATSASVGIGAGVVINLVNITNKATTGSATINGTSLSVTAGMAVNDTDPVYRFNSATSAWVLLDSRDRPADAPSDGTFYNLTAAMNSTYGPGIYKYSSGTSSWTLQSTVAQIATAGHQVTSLPATGSTDQLDQVATHEVRAVAIAGASQTTDAGIAGAVAMNLASNDTEATVGHSSAGSVTLGTGDLTLSAACERGRRYERGPLHGRRRPAEQRQQQQRRWRWRWRLRCRGRCLARAQHRHLVAGDRRESTRRRERVWRQQRHRHRDRNARRPDHRPQAGVKSARLERGRNRSGRRARGDDRRLR